MLTLDITDITIDGNVRNEVGDVTGLADSITRVGLLQPPVVVLNSDTGKYQLIAGARRLAALTLLGKEQVTVVATEDSLRAAITRRVARASGLQSRLWP